MTARSDEPNASELDGQTSRPPGMQPEDLPDEIRLGGDLPSDPDSSDTPASSDSEDPDVTAEHSKAEPSTGQTGRPEPEKDTLAVRAPDIDATNSLNPGPIPAPTPAPAASARFRKFVPHWLGRALTTTDRPLPYDPGSPQAASGGSDASSNSEADESSSSALGTAKSSPDSPALQTPVKSGFGLAVGVALAVMAWLILAELSQLLTWIALALFIALGMDPIVRFFVSRGWRRWVGVLVVVLVLLAFVAGFLSLLIPALITQISELTRRAPAILDDVTAKPMVQKLDAQFHLIDKVGEEVRSIINSPDTLANVINAGNFVGEFFFGTLIVFVLATYFLASLPQLKLFVFSFAPASSRQRVAVLSENITRSVGNYVMGQATVAIVNACFSFILMTIFGIPYSLLLALCVAMLAFIPLVGGVAAGTLVVIVSLFSLSWQSTLLYAILYIVYLQVEAYFISPRIMSRAVKVPGAVVVIAVIAGGALFGVLGALMAIPVAAAAITLIKEVFFRRQDAR
ncbi:AI-2E family transporter [Pseudoglutamicibacter albus]|uniref:PurR-regulated permease PerM n=2 Tax=Pseudoglutamicibacter albus TaxID=98671 RepID=A0ABU1YZC9_9MICC|nr:AI-2E family transporter [Pseudoglutamicibacter albus]MDR7293718.1 putative PurR-regulated permease PerM [Pseudoglutamicibacter albus]